MKVTRQFQSLATGQTSFISVEIVERLAQKQPCVVKLQPEGGTTVDARPVEVQRCTVPQRTCATSVTRRLEIQVMLLLVAVLTDTL